MKKWVLLLALLCAACSQSEAGFLMTSQSGGGAPPSWLLNETFEGTGYSDGSWTETITGDSTAIEDCTGTPCPLEGSQSLSLYFDWLGDSDYTTRTLSASYDEIWMEFMWRSSDVANGVDLLQLLDSSNNVAGSVFMADDSLVYGNNTQATNDSYDSVVNTTYYMWLHYKKGTGANSEIDGYISANTTKPGTASFSRVNGNSQYQVNKVRLFHGVSGNQPNNGTTFYFDHVQLHNGNTVWTDW